jgi:glucokinase
MVPVSRRSQSRVLGLDVGATKVSAAVVAEDGQVLSHGGRALHENESPEAVIRDLVQVVHRSLGEGDPPTAIGVGVAGQVDATTGIVRHAPNLRWRDVPLGTALSSEFHCPVIVANDVRAATVGEWKHGAGKGETDLLCIFVGTGIGGGVVSGGRLLEGASNAFGEVGHSVLVAGGRPCHCPARGCLEAYVGGWAIAERTVEQLRANPAGGRELIRRAGSRERINARIVGEAALAGDPMSRSIMIETANYLAWGVVGLVNAFNPARVLMGGGIVEGSPEVVGVVADRVRTHCQPPAAEAVSVSRVALGHDAALVGAAALARELLAARRAVRPGRPALRRSAGGVRP